MSEDTIQNVVQSFAVKPFSCCFCSPLNTDDISGCSVFFRNGALVDWDLSNI